MRTPGCDGLSLTPMEEFLRLNREGLAVSSRSDKTGAIRAQARFESGMRLTRFSSVRRDFPV